MMTFATHLTVTTHIGVCDAFDGYDTLRIHHVMATAHNDSEGLSHDWYQSRTSLEPFSRGDLFPVVG
jgi:hypothetical protein